MDDFLVRAAGWWLGTAVGGGLILLVACVAMQWTKQPAARQRLGEWAVLSALVVAVLRLGPTWLTLPWEPSAAHAEALPAEVAETATAPPLFELRPAPVVP